MTGPLTVRDLADRVGGEVVGDAAAVVSGLAEVDAARPGELTFIGNEEYARRWARSGATAALIARGLDAEPGEGRGLIRVDSADLALAKVLELFAPDPPTPHAECELQRVHPTAVVDASATLGEGVCIGPGCYVGPRVTLGEGCVLYANVTIVADCELGAGCVLWPGVVLRERSRLGRRCVLQPNVVLGADGFGYRPMRGEGGQVTLVKLPHLGGVRLGDEVELGAGTCVDRGKFADTTIGDGTKIDNLVQVGHNCRIGRCVVISGCTGVAGSVTIGDGVVIGGAVGFADHITIGAGAKIAGFSGVMHDVPPGEEWAGTPARPLREAVRHELALRRLPDRVRALERRRRES